MYKATELLALPIRDIKEGAYHGQAKDILFSAKKGQYFLELNKKCLGQAEILASEDIAGIGKDFILIEKKSDIKGVLLADEILRFQLSESYVLLGVEVVDEAGCQLGKVVDLTIDEAGVVSSIVLDGGATLEKDEIISVCSEVIFVRGKGGFKEAESLEEEKPEVPIGLTVNEDVVSEDGSFEIKKGSVITEEIFKKAMEHDAILALGLVAK